MPTTVLVLLAVLACAVYPSLVHAEPVADDLTVGTTAGVPVVVSLHATDTADVALTFAVEQAPVHGTLGAIDSPECTLSPGLTTCTATVLYTPNTAYAGTDAFTYRASAGLTPSGAATVALTVTASAPVMPPDATVDTGEPYATTVTGVVTGATVDWGDGTPAETLLVNPDASATLAHVYALEGSFVVTVTNAPGIAGTSMAHVFISGSTGTSIETVDPGETGTITLPGLTATLERSEDGGGTATILGARFPPDLADFIEGGRFGDTLSAFDLRVVAAGDHDVATVTFAYPETGPRSRPVLTYFSPVTHAFEPVAGSTLVTPSLTIDPAARTITVVFDRTSTPPLTGLTGTRLVVSDRSVPQVIEVAVPSTTLAGARVRVHTGLAVFCPSQGPPCAIALNARAAFTPTVAPLRAPGVVIGKRKMRCAPGKSADLLFVLAPKSRRALERLQHLPMTLAIRARVVGHPAAVVMRTLSVDAP